MVIFASTCICIWMEKEKLEAILNNGSKAMLISDSHGNIIFFNSLAVRLLHYDFSEIKDSSLFSLLHEDSYQSIRAFISSESLGRTTQNEKAVLVRKDGRPLTVHLLINRVAYEESNVFIITLEELREEIDTTLIHFKRTAEHARDIMAVYDFSFQCLYINQACHHILGYFPAEYAAIGSFVNFIQETERKSIEAALRRDQNNKITESTYTYHSVHKDGGLILIDNFVSIIYDKTGQVQYLLSYEKAAHQHYTSFPEEELLLLVDQELHIDYASPHSERMLHYSPQELKGMPSLLNLLHPDDQKKFNNSYPEMDGGMESTAFQLPIKHQQKGFVTMELTFNRCYDQGGNFAYGIAHLRQEKNGNPPSSYPKQATDWVFNHLPDAILIFDLSGGYLMDCNIQTLKLFEVENKSELEHGLSPFLVNQENADTQQFLQQERTAQPVISHIQYTTRRGKAFWGKTTVVDVTTDGYSFRIIQVSDITEQKLREEKLQSEKETAEQNMKLREEFLSTMSHEIRTPLNAVLGLTHLMLQKEPREDQTKLLQTIRFAGDHLTALINDTLDYSKIEAGKLALNKRDFNLKAFLHGIKLTYKNLANEKGLTFRLLLEEDIPGFVHGDVNRLGQILNNLLNNALKFTSEGQIVLSVCMEEEQAEHCMLRFEVADTGIGIPVDKREIIFDPYQQASIHTATQYGGTGLGLSIVHKLVKLHHGKLLLESQEGQGTTFKVSLPFGKPETPGNSHENEPFDFALKDRSLENLKVLYVEDVVANQLLMEGLCDHWKITLEIASNGLEALEKVKHNQYDLILMDIQMPEKNGYETAADIRNLKEPYFQNIPIIALTASVSEKTHRVIKEAGMNGYLSKPIIPKDLYNMLSQYDQYTSKSVLIEEKNSAQSHLPNTLDYITDTPDFSQLHALYLDDDESYCLILEQILKLTRESIPPVLEAIRDNNEKAFRFGCHKLMSYVRLLKLRKLDELIELTKSMLVKQIELTARENLTTEFHCHFQNFMKATEEESIKYS